MRSASQHPGARELAGRFFKGQHLIEGAHIPGMNHPIHEPWRGRCQARRGRDLRSTARRDEVARFEQRLQLPQRLLFGNGVVVLERKVCLAHHSTARPFQLDRLRQSCIRGAIKRTGVYGNAFVRIAIVLLCGFLAAHSPRLWGYPFVVDAWLWQGVRDDLFTTHVRDLPLFVAAAMVVADLVGRWCPSTAIAVRCL